MAAFQKGLLLYRGTNDYRKLPIYVASSQVKQLFQERQTEDSFPVLDKKIYLTGCTQSTVLPVPTRHRRHACIKMRTAIPANTQTRPNVVSMLVQRRWRWANIETALSQMLAFAGLHTGVCLHPPLCHHNILASRSGYF